MKKFFIILSVFIIIPTWSFSSSNKLLMEIRSLEKQGKYKQIDTLYSELDSLGNISSHNLMKWAEAKFVIGDEIGAAKLYCRADNGRTRFLIRNSFLKNLKEVNDTLKGQQSLNKFFNCKLNSTDSTDYINWIIRTSSTLNYHSLEEDFIDKYYSSESSYPDELISSSIKRISKGYPKEALRTSLKAFNSSKIESQKQVAASIIFKSYLMIENNDSAFAWMKRSQLNRTTEITEAIILCQKTKNLSISDSLIQLLPVGINKDTLQLRNFIYKNDFKSSIALVDSLNKRYKNNYVDILLFWKARLFLFSGRGNEFIEIVMSDEVKKIGYNKNIKTDFLKWKTIITRLNSENDIIKILGSISKYHFIGNYEPFDPFIQLNKYPLASREILLTEYMKGIINNEEYIIGRLVLNHIPQESSNEELKYYKGIIEINSNSIESGKKTLEELIVNGKGSLFSQKARMYLLEKFSNN